MRRVVATALLVTAFLAGGSQAAPARTANERPAASVASSGTASAAARWQPGVRSARRYARRRRGDVRFAVIGLDGRMQAFHGGRPAPAASVFKAMLLAAYLRKGGVRDRPLRERDRDLLRPMITRSDNETASSVDDIVGPRRIRQLARDAGMRDFRYSRSAWGLSRINARDQAGFFRRYERYVPDRHDTYARKLLESIVPSQRWGVGEARPRGWRLFFKGGWGTGTGRVNHQVAWVERGRHRVALAMLTEFNPSHGYGSRTLEGLAERLLRGLPRL